ncbi:putative integral membrane protein [Streptomyces ambofaciens ATCC 23877]|uniref:Putative integral membrane protein n=1 Tax=Streptomyces ambofaciens (strain ATCC 23877 / 3486 / DSM 40053 / JCM 4204 / NBRC 12836 / NRRL B-2516) TaxID=278992 RepID=A3KJQ9_STRA7|nr:PI-PLC domain-containing protein [Streptomyces ambofaciens]AKZ54098.1 putative integral membrane protein [Streptomyces ambofaciens ATCC 23877]CAJ89944.1 putative integral membrane protein [Streptomyces ambofaciens ATCC 23877]
MDGLVRRSPWAGVLIWCVAVLSTTVLAAAAVVRSTVLDPDFYGQVLEDERAYQRFYDEVLVDPVSTPLTSDLLDRLPVPQSTITSNLKVVIPPETLRVMTDRQIAEVIHYLEGDRDRLRVTVDLEPVVANVERLSQAYFGDAVAALQQRSEPDFQAFVQRLSELAAQVVAGEAPLEGLPSLPLSHGQAVAATDALMRLVPDAARAGLGPTVQTALDRGDVASALAAVAPVALNDRVRTTAAELLREARQGTWIVTVDIDPAHEALAPVDRARSVTRLFQEVVEPAAAVLCAAALTLLWLTTPSPARRRLMPLGWVPAAAAALMALTVLLLRLALDSALFGSPSSWPPSASDLLGDVQATAVDRLLTTATVVAVILLAAGALLITVSWVWQTRPGMPVLTDPRHGPTLTFAVTACALVGTMVAPVAITGSSPRICQGSAELCDARYDEIAQLASHNAMATTADRFIGPLQDPDIVGQLDAGVRVLLLDTHHWERPKEVADRLSSSDFPPELRRRLTRILERVNPPHPGLWLCHSVCGAGALDLVPTLRQIGDWLRAHPTEVVTLVLQDGVGPVPSQGAFERAGLSDLLYEPDADPDRPWPKLEDMIDGGRRLVVFAEKADGPAPWYRNFYRYGMETPFAFRSPDEMSCLPNRGGTDKRLFLLNHFVTAGGGRRLDAGLVNSRQRVLERAHNCERRRGRPVNFVAVDYATIGDALGAVEELNAERRRDDSRFPVGRSPGRLPSAG